MDGYFTGAVVIREYTVISFQNNTQNAFQFLNDQDFLHLLHVDWDYGLEHGIQARFGYYGICKFVMHHQMSGQARKCIS